MKTMIWLSPSLAAGAIAARLVAFFERRSQMSLRWDAELTAPPAPPVAPHRAAHLAVPCADGGPPTVLRLDSPRRGDDSHADRRGSPWARRGPG